MFLINLFNLFYQASLLKQGFWIIVLINIISRNQNCRSIDQLVNSLLSIQILYDSINNQFCQFPGDC